MPYYFFNWDEINSVHIADNDVLKDDFEAVVCDPIGVGFSRSSGRPIAFGYTASGEKIGCVYEQEGDTIYPITAYYVED